MFYSLLGHLEARRAGRPLPLGGRKQRATLGLLLLRANEVVSTKELMYALWQGEPPTTARQILQNAITGLRRLLPPGSLLTRTPGYVLRVPDGSRDLDEFRSLVELGRARASAGTWEPASRDFRNALALRRGPALADLATSGVTWPELVTVEDEQLCAVEALFEAELACGRHTQVVQEAESWSRAHPRRERLCAQLMLALYRAGRQAEALATYRRNRQVLVEELGLEPGPELRDLERAILVHDPALTAIVPPAVVADPTRVERKRVSVLLIRAALEEVAGGDVERFGDLAHRFANMVRQEMGHFDGTLLWADGSTCSVVFGAPRTHEDDAERAVRVALRLRTSLATGIGLTTQTAVATGDALVRYPAHGGKPPEVTGPVIDRCRQAVTVVPADRIHVCEVTRRLAAPVFRFARDTSSEQGWELLGTRDEPAPEPDQPEGTPLLERDRELALLHGVLNRVGREERPHLVTVLGEPGVGKSRLLAEFAAAVRALPEAPLILMGRTPAFGEGAALAAVTGIVMAYAGIVTTDPVEEVRRKLHETVHGLVDPEQATWVLSQLRPLLGLAVGGDQHDAAEVGAAWRRFLEAIAARHPLIVFVEDLHWADDTLLDSLEHLTDNVAPAPLLVVATARPELVRRRPGWCTTRRGTSTLTLAPLSDGATRQLFRALVNHHGLGEAVAREANGDFARALLARVGGIPLFAVEYARMVRDRGLSPEPSSGSLPLPDTVQSVVAARLDTLPRPQKNVLQVAAVFGGSLRPEALVALGCGERRTVEQLLDSLVERELLLHRAADRAGGEGEYTFGHALIRDVAYQQLPREVRAELHRLAADWFETLPLPPAELLAHHYHQAVTLAEVVGLPVHDLKQRACTVLADAGSKAFTLRAFTAAAHCYEIALQLCPVTDPARPHLLLGYGKSLVASSGSSSDSAFGENILVEAQDALMAGGHRVAAADAEVNLAVEARIRGEDPAAREHLRRALELVADVPPSAHKAEVECAAANLSAIGSRCGEAIGLAGKVLSAAYRFDRPDLLSRGRQALGVARTKAGEADGVVHFERAIALCEQYGIATTDPRHNLAWSYAEVGELERRGSATAAAHEAAKRYGSPFEVAWRQTLDAIDCYWAGTWDDSIRAADKALRYAAASPPKSMRRMAARIHAWRGRIRLARDDLAGAIADAAQAGEQSRTLTEPHSVQCVLLFRARIEAVSGHAALAAELIERLLANADGLRPAPDLGIDLPIMLSATGHTERALSAFAASYWLDAAHRLLAGDYLAAADTYARIGSRPDEARARLLAARALATDDPGEAGRQGETGRALAAAMGATSWPADDAHFVLPTDPARSG